MLSFEAAKKIGVNACIDKIGRDFVTKNKDNSTSAYGEGEGEGEVYCYVGVAEESSGLNDSPDKLYLTADGFPYYASCNVSMMDGSITFLECVVPER